MIKCVAILFLCLALATTNIYAVAIDSTCAPVTANVHLCSQVLNGGGAAAMTPQCRDGLIAIEAAMAVVGERATCRCVFDCLAVHFPGVLRALSDAVANGVDTAVQGIPEVFRGCVLEQVGVVLNP